MKAKFEPSENRIKKQFILIEMKFFHKNSRYSLFDHKRNEEILEQLTVEPADEKLRRYKLNWLRRVTRMNSSNMAKIMLK